MASAQVMAQVPTLISGDSDPSDGIQVTIGVVLSRNQLKLPDEARATIISGQVVDIMNTHFPPESTPGGVYDIRVIATVGRIPAIQVPLVGDRNTGEKWEDILPGSLLEAIVGQVSQAPQIVALNFDGCNGSLNLFTGTFDTITYDPGTIFEAERRLGGSWQPWYDGDETCLPSPTSSPQMEMRVRTLSIFGPSAWVIKVAVGNCGGGSQW